MREFKPNDHLVDERHFAAAKSIEKYVLDRNWYKMAEILVEDERLSKDSYIYSRFPRAFRLMGYYKPPFRLFFSRSMQAYEYIQKYNIKRNRFYGIDSYFAYYLMRWYDEGELTRSETYRLLKYRQKYFNRRHPIGFEIFDISNKNALQPLLDHEEQDESSEINLNA